MQTSQVKVLTKSVEFRETQIDVPLLIIRTFDRIACLKNGHLNSEWKMFEARLWLKLRKTCAYVAVRLVLGNILLLCLFGSAVWTQTGSVAKLNCLTIIRHLGEATMPAIWGRGQYSVFAYYTLAFRFQMRKITENLSQCIRIVLCLWKPCPIRFLDLAIVEWEPWVLVTYVSFSFRVVQCDQPFFDVRTCRVVGLGIPHLVSMLADKSL
jgi:hypothetical protein